MKILLLGASGMLGSEVLMQARERGHEVLTSHVRLDEEFSQADLPQGLDVIINCAGNTAMHSEEVESLIEVNALGVAVLMRAAHARKTRLVHMSTDCVFSGGIGAAFSYETDDTPGPVDIYGASKRLGELAVLAAPRNLVVRGSFIGLRHGFLRWLLDARGTVKAYMNARWNGAAVWHMASALLDLAESGQTDIVHVAAEKPVTKAWMVEYLVEALDLPVSIEVVPEPRVNRALTPDILLPPVQQSLDEIVQRVKAQEVLA